jgi:hypothetical protein
MNIYANVEAILGLSFRNLRGYNIGDIDERDLGITLLKWDQVP